MTGRLIQVAKSAYQYPLILKQLWHAPIVQAPDQEVVYRDLKRFTYRDIRERIGRLASALHGIGVRPGDTVGVLDWDSNRFLEAFFAIPMMGAVLQTVNVRLSPEQIAYTINHAEASTLLVNEEFVGLVEGLKPQLPKVKNSRHSLNETLNLKAVKQLPKPQLPKPLGPPKLPGPPKPPAPFTSSRSLIDSSRASAGVIKSACSMVFSNMSCIPFAS